MEKEEKIKLGISIGDLNGIGGELVIKTFEDSRMLEFCTPVIYASVKTLSFFKKHFESSIDFNSIQTAEKAVESKVNVITVWKDDVKINFGEEDLIIGSYAIKSLQAAVKDLKDDQIDVLVTAPINKHNIQSEDFKFPGHTDYLAQQLEGDSLMFMVSDNLKVGLLTDHVPVSEVSKQITPESIENKISIIYNSLVQDFNIRLPKIAVLGLNPHTGDNGVIGNEDDEVLRPTLQAIKNRGKVVYGPYSADSFFGSKNYKNFDAILATYHDQGLIPFKTLAFGSGVNFTAGLSKVRTSPDHGTAYEIAGKGVADISSFKEAIFSAISIFRNRQMNQKLTSNPLTKQPKKAYNKK
ncbi:4-hydroxythreonine-4-phosphate dehydrogenase PdxA [Flavobacteriaceae bacterium]|jgi:4-hydroxythreonine-4-phosphate dehydrogenase|nr:4-hydroxythreonine-4-phosphate dehydrogenase PdxA [Flavobacteriaceae bacterium]MDC3351050.1 4-hydroxythreonine-4-phosphate dehydrogenase PdxA [Flavobacteriaceae bacterium]|tara:strand:+ start:2876 stop:3934 length:1059 start_codon:yes stop_codon:yes gene_type:complete